MCIHFLNLTLELKQFKDAQTRENFPLIKVCPFQNLYYHANQVFKTACRLHFIYNITLKMDYYN